MTGPGKNPVGAARGWSVIGKQGAQITDRHAQNCVNCGIRLREYEEKITKENAHKTRARAGAEMCTTCYQRLRKDRLEAEKLAEKNAPRIYKVYVKPSLRREELVVLRQAQALVPAENLADVLHMLDIVAN